MVIVIIIMMMMMIIIIIITKMMNQSSSNQGHLPCTRLRFISALTRSWRSKLNITTHDPVAISGSCTSFMETQFRLPPRRCVRMEG